MLIQITNKCMMGCSHCLQDSTENGAHMTMEMVDKAVAFAKKSNTMVVLLSGGEPTEHPRFKEVVERFLSFPQVAIASNGMWIDDERKVKEMQALMQHKNVELQISNFSAYYPKAINQSKIKALFPKAFIVTRNEVVQLKALGRTTKSRELMEKAKNSEGTMSCFASALTSVQLPYLDAMLAMFMRGKLCHPLVDINGNLHWSESWLCPSFANIQEPFEDICRKAHEWKPCMRCADAKKLINNNTPNYIQAKKVLGIKA